MLSSNLKAWGRIPSLPTLLVDGFKAKFSMTSRFAFGFKEQLLDLACKALTVSLKDVHWVCRISWRKLYPINPPKTTRTYPTSNFLYSSQAFFSGEAMALPTVAICVLFHVLLSTMTVLQKINIEACCHKRVSLSAGLMKRRKGVNGRL